MTLKLTRATIARLGLEPGDVIVVTVTDEHRMLTSEQAARIIEMVKAACGEYQVIVIPFGLEITKLAVEAA